MTTTATYQGKTKAFPYGEIIVRDGADGRKTTVFPDGEERPGAPLNLVAEQRQWDAVESFRKKHGHAPGEKPGTAKKTPPPKAEKKAAADTKAKARPPAKAEQKTGCGGIAADRTGNHAQRTRPQSAARGQGEKA